MWFSALPPAPGQLADRDPGLYVPCLLAHTPAADSMVTLCRRRVEEGAANPHLARLSEPEAESSLTRVTSLPCQPVPAFA